MTGLAGCGSSGSSGFPSDRLAPRPAITAPLSSSATSSTSSTQPVISCPSVVDIGQWSNGRLAAQMLAISTEMATIADVSQAVSGGVGGVVLAGTSSSPDLKTEIANMQQLDKGGVRQLFMTDEEGGGIQGLSGLVGSMPWPRSMAGSMTTAQVESLTFKVGQAMRSLGVTMDLAPVVDLDAGPGPSKTNPDGSRSFSADPSVAVKYAQAYMTGLAKAGVISVLKHFPGLGGASGNTDFTPAHTLQYAQLIKTGLVPFEKLAPGARAVMISNASIPGLTDGVPASLSAKAIAVLRNVVGFKGLIISDSLETVSIASYQPDLGKAVVDAAVAGVDMIMLASSNPNQVPSYLAAKQALSQAIASGVFPRSSAEASVGKILLLKGYDSSCIYF
ncbi:MAG: glycoside hydrolase family 3 protein [Acidimicrobiaceae bacterium]|nr:glycoside hydrolase family 3 protein [Acidimicrobiaceae bacterium]